MENRRNIGIDALKGLAIIAIVIYHFGGGFLPYGYLGVEVFLVISGYLLMKSLIRAFADNSFSYWRFITDKVVRLWPMVLIFAGISLLTGYFVMLPDDYENLSQSVIAANVFMNNVLACITTKNYWDVVNAFKPLMHTWYLGVLMQAYVVLPLILMASYRISGKHKAALPVATFMVTMLSLGMYLFPGISAAQKFYFVHTRLFEMTAGAMVAFVPKRQMETQKQRGIVLGSCVALALLCAAICIQQALIPDWTRLLLTVAATVMLVTGCQMVEYHGSKLLQLLAIPGRASMSVYICHQVLVAFMFYSITDKKSIWILMAFLLVTGIVSTATYFLLEKPINGWAKARKWLVFALCGVLCVALTGAAGLVYLRAGVVRDIPELGIEKDHVHRGMHAEYCDIPYQWNRDFTQTDKVRVAVIGNSFGRDWANILNESGIAGDIEISYIYPHSMEYVRGLRERLDDADFVFCTLWLSDEEVDEQLIEMIPEDKLYVVGYKSFGSSNGIVYARRGLPGYLSQSVRLTESVFEHNEMLQEKYGEHFIDMLSPVRLEDGSIRVFSDDGRFLSQDCRHLTKAGAEYYANRLDLEWILTTPTDSAEE